MDKKRKTRRIRSSLPKKHKAAHYYPLLLDLRRKRVVVVGGGRVAERKVRTLLASSAQIRLISPKLTPGLRKILRQGRFQWCPRNFRGSDLRGTPLIFVTTDDQEVNPLIADRARKLNKLVNVADHPERSNFIVPAIVRRGDLLIAISTSGHSPALARRIRQELEKSFGREFSYFVEILGRIRKALIARIPQEGRRKRIFHQLVRSEILDLLRSGRFALAKRRAREIAGLKGMPL